MNINLVIWYNFFPLQQLGVNVLGVVCIFAWTTIWITALFLLLKFVNLHRVTEEEELDGKYRCFISIDPDRVTIAGTSAGGASVHLHMMSSLSKGKSYNNPFGKN